MDRIKVDTYESRLNQTGQFFRYYLEQMFPGMSGRHDLILKILSVQDRLIWNVDMQAWQIEGKKKHGKKLRLVQFLGVLPSQHEEGIRSLKS